MLINNSIGASHLQSVIDTPIFVMMFGLRNRIRKQRAMHSKYILCLLTQNIYVTQVSEAVSMLIGLHIVYRQFQERIQYFGMHYM